MTKPEFRCLGASWVAKPEARQGWAAPSIAEAQRLRWPSVLRFTESNEPLGVLYEAAEVSNGSYSAHNTIMSFSYVLGRALYEKSGRSLSVLDFGGGSGQYCEFASVLYPNTPFDYHVYDSPELCALGKKMCPAAIFHDGPSAFARSYDLVVASGSIHYFEDWKMWIWKLSAIAEKFLYLSRVPMVYHSPTFVTAQTPKEHGYDTELVGWCFNRRDLLQCFQDGKLKVLREFLVDERPECEKAPELMDSRGFLLLPRR